MGMSGMRIVWESYQKGGPNTVRSLKSPLKSRKADRFDVATQLLELPHRRRFFLFGHGEVKWWLS